jgi:hypothetical protein
MHDLSAKKPGRGHKRGKEIYPQDVRPRFFFESECDHNRLRIIGFRCTFIRQFLSKAKLCFNALVKVVRPTCYARIKN